ncbi:MAG: MGMT family protein [Proteobacteria bacterium]|nr:MGMT family protein [Pseudomonadota bacterium]MBU1708901.1 MGMT family protein [Pseudomonadota bacterium]
MIETTIFQIGRCSISGIPVHTLELDDKVIYLSFSEESLFRAKNQLHSDNSHCLFKNTRNLTLCKKISAALHGDKTFAFPADSPFIKKATLFQKKVWELISTIPHGETLSYGELAEKLGGKSYARAVGNACNTNPVALIIPCHRVVGRNGIGGFAGGISIKQKLLELEKNKSG